MICVIPYAAVKGRIERDKSPEVAKRTLEEAHERDSAQTDKDPEVSTRPSSPKMADGGNKARKKNQKRRQMQRNAPKNTGINSPRLIS